MVTQAKGVEHKLPIGSAKDEALSMRQLPFSDFAIPTPSGVEVNIFDSANVIDLVDQNTAAKRLPRKVPDIVPCRSRCVNSLVRIQQFHIEDRSICALHPDCPWIRNRLSVSNLLRISDGQPTNGTVGVQRNEERSFFVPLATS